MKKLLLGAAALLVAAGGVAIAQLNVNPATVLSVGTADLFQDIVAGAPSPSSRYASAAQIAGVPGYVNGGAVVTAWAFTFGNAQTDYFIQPTGTLATGVLTTAPNPGDGQRECFLSTQTQTAITWTANTGQSLANAPTAGVAMTPQCMTYSAATLTWYRSP